MARDKAPAASSRGRGKFKVSRGGGRHFSRDIAIDHQMENLGLGASGSEEDSSSEEESEPETNTASPYANVKLGPVEPEMTRAERKAMKKVQAGKGKGKGESGEEGSEEEEEALPTRDNFGPSRKEKEAAAAVAAKERYEKLHAAGKTDQYKKDMERLQEVRRRREQEAAERKAKDEEANKEAEQKRQARLAGRR